MVNWDIASNEWQGYSVVYQQHLEEEE